MLNDLDININPVEELYNQDIYVPGDISSAAFIIVGALITKGSEVLIKNVGLNKTRTGIIDVVKNMNGNIEIINQRFVGGETSWRFISKVQQRFKWYNNR